MLRSPVIRSTQCLVPVTPNLFVKEYDLGGGTLGKLVLPPIQREAFAFLSRMECKSPYGIHSAEQQPAAPSSCRCDCLDDVVFLIEGTSAKANTLCPIADLKHPSTG